SHLSSALSCLSRSNLPPHPLHSLSPSLLFLPAFSHSFFFFNDTAPPEIYTLSLHDALPISPFRRGGSSARTSRAPRGRSRTTERSEEHTSELQSLTNLVCRLLLEKKKKKKKQKYKWRQVAVL